METTTKPLTIRPPDPIQAFRFLVRLGDGSNISAAFSRFSGVKMEMETFQSRDGDDIRGVKDYVPVFTSFAPVTLSKGVIGDNAFLNWVFSASAGPHTGPSDDNLRRTIDVVALDEDGEARATWTLQNALPIGYELSPMDGSRSEVLTESLTFAITGIKRDVKAPTAPPLIPTFIPGMPAPTPPLTPGFIPGKPAPTPPASATPDPTES